MRILLLTPYYLDLYLPIVAELEKEGHNVILVEDNPLMCDPYIRKTEIIEKIRQYYHCIQYAYQKKYELFWEEQFRIRKEMSIPFDILFVINGCSFHNCLLKRLKEHNPQIKSVLYVWDSSRYYDYFRSRRSFDKIFTFDYLDSIKYNATFLPFYWVDDIKNHDFSLKYKMSIVGSNHDGRFAIVSKIVSQFKKLGYNNLCCKLYVERRSLREEEQIEYNRLKISKKDSGILRDYEFILGKEKSDIIVNNPIPLQETLKIMRQSEIILDTDRETQSGTTPRVIWALAMGKRIISTNRNLQHMPFFDPNFISIIDRENPILDIDFISKRNEDGDIPDYVQQLSIDRWIKNFIIK